MDINSTQPIHIINKYIWDQIAGQGIMTKTDYRSTDFPAGIVPIVPIKETPQLLQIIEQQAGVKALPYIVYTWNKIPSGQEWFLKTHDMAYAIRSPDSVKTSKLINLFDTLFKDFDAAARRVNDYLYLSGTTTQKAYHFKKIEVQTLGAEMPSDRENGVDEALITIRATFSGG